MVGSRRMQSLAISRKRSLVDPEQDHSTRLRVGWISDVRVSGPVRFRRNEKALATCH